MDIIADMEITDQQKLGVGLGGFGVFFLLLGVLMLFDKGLLAIGNLFCIAGGFQATSSHDLASPAQGSSPASVSSGR